METKFFLCTVCGNVVVKTVDSGMNLTCCNKEMMELIPMDVDGPREKHLPVVEFKGDDTIKVKIGSLAHPMSEDHLIRFIYLETVHGGQIRYLEPGMAPEAVFHFGKDKPLAVYAYCNIHGLWKVDVKRERKGFCYLLSCH